MTADPGGIFDSDEHRRVLAHLPLPSLDPISEDDFLERIHTDEGATYAEDEPVEILKDLEADGYAGQTKAGWKQTKKGLEALNAPVPEEG